MRKRLLSITQFKTVCFCLLLCLVSLSSACQQSVDSNFTDLTDYEPNSNVINSTETVTVHWYDFHNLINQPNFSIVKLGKDENHSLNYNAEFLKTFEESDRPTVIYCITTWSETAYKNLPVIIDLYQKYADFVDFYVINTEDCASLAEKYNIDTVPTILLKNNKEIVWRKIDFWQALKVEVVAELKPILADQGRLVNTTNN